MKGLRAAAAIVAGSLLVLGPAAFGQEEPETGYGGGYGSPYGQYAPPRRPIPYTQLRRPRPAAHRTAAAPTRPGRTPRIAGPAPAHTAVRTPDRSAAAVPAPPRPAAAPRIAAPASAHAAVRAPDRPIAATPAAPGLAAPPPTPVARNGARLAPSEPIPPAELEAFVDGVLREAMGAERLAGAAVSVVQNGQIVLLKGYGQAVLPAPGRSGRPVDPRATLFRLGSASRILTSIEAMKSAELGRLKFDQPVNYLLPPALRIGDDDVRRPILVRHLITSTAGFEERALGRLYVADPARLLAQGAALVAHPPRREFAPGEVSSESAYGTALLGAVLASTAHKRFDDLIEAELAGPLKLTRTTFREPYPARSDLPAPMAPTLARDLAQGYRWTSRGFAPVPFTFAQSYAPAASASTTAADMARLMTALISGGSLEGVQAWGPGAARLLRTPFQRAPAGVNDWPGGLAAGSLPGGWRTVGYSGGALGSRVALTVAPDLKLGVFIATNTDTAGGTVGALAGRIAERFYAPPSPRPRAGSPAVSGNAAAYAGRYVSSARARHGLERVIDRLTRAVELRVTPDGYLLLRDQGRTRLWAPEGASSPPSLFRAADGEQTLLFSWSGGRADGFTPSDNRASYTRVGWFLHPRLLILGALAVAMAAGLGLLGLFLRFGRDVRRTDAQLIGGALQAGVGVLWLSSFAAFVAWEASMPDAAALMTRWPGLWLIVASSLALLAFLGSLLSAAQLIEIWRTDRRGGGWSRWRKFRHTTTTTVFVAFGVLLTLWGALTPWSP